MVPSSLFGLAPMKLEWMQVGVSSHTLAEPVGHSLRATYGDRWQARHMPLEVFQQVTPELRHVRLVHFQGWGEPLANPDFFRMAALAVKAGCAVSTAVFAPSVLDDQAMEHLAGLGVQTLTVNISSLDEQRNKQRTGVSLEAICRMLERFGRIKAAMGAERPLILALYSLHRSSMDELARLPAFLARQGVDMVLVNPLSFAATKAMVQEMVVPDSEEEFAAVQARLEEVRTEAGRRGMGMHYFLLHGERSGACLENTPAALFLGATGDVSPCIFAQFPVSGEAFYYFKEMSIPAQRIVFGNVRERTLRQIWSSPQYRRFRKQCNSLDGAGECGACWRPHIRAF